MASNDLSGDELVKVISTNMNRREKMIDPFFNGENVPSDPREMRLLNEIMSSQTGDATTLLSIYEQGKGNDNVEAIKDMMADVMRMNGIDDRPTDVPVLEEYELPTKGIVPVTENNLIELRKYIKEDE